MSATVPVRGRLPNRRHAVTENIEVGGFTYEATVGFDKAGRPKEIFLSGAKDGSDMAAVLADTSVVVSVALQHGVAAQAMALSLLRVPPSVEGGAPMPASLIGAALDLVARYEREDAA